MSYELLGTARLHIGGYHSIIKAGTIEGKRTEQTARQGTDRILEAPDMYSLGGAVGASLLKDKWEFGAELSFQRHKGAYSAFPNEMSSLNEEHIMLTVNLEGTVRYTLYQISSVQLKPFFTAGIGGSFGFENIRLSSLSAAHSEGDFDGTGGTILDHKVYRFGLTLASKDLKRFSLAFDIGLEKLVWDEEISATGDSKVFTQDEPLYNIETNRSQWDLPVLGKVAPYLGVRMYY